MLKPAYIASLLIVIILLGHLNFSVYAQDSPSITKIGPLLANENKSTSISNPEFTLFNNISGLVAYGLGPFWKDIFGYCKTSFECVSDNTTGWMDNSSLKVSTRGDNSKNKGTSNWSWIYGNELSVNPGERYEVVTHMKLNEYAVQSHVAQKAITRHLRFGTR